MYGVNHEFFSLNTINYDDSLINSTKTLQGLTMISIGSRIHEINTTHFLCLVYHTLAMAIRRPRKAHNIHTIHPKGMFCNYSLISRATQGPMAVRLRANQMEDMDCGDQMDPIIHCESCNNDFHSKLPR